MTAHYYSPELDSDNPEDRLGAFDRQTKAILNVPWDDKTRSYESKVEEFFNILVDFVALLQTDAEVRTFAYSAVVF